jgi:uncharacterized membrane protein
VAIFLLLPPCLLALLSSLLLQVCHLLVFLSSIMTVWNRLYTCEPKVCRI